MSTISVSNFQDFAKYTEVYLRESIISQNHCPDFRTSLRMNIDDKLLITEHFKIIIFIQVSFVLKFNLLKFPCGLE